MFAEHLLEEFLDKISYFDIYLGDANVRGMTAFIEAFGEACKKYEFYVDHTKEMKNILLYLYQERLLTKDVFFTWYQNPMTLSQIKQAVSDLIEYIESHDLEPEEEEEEEYEEEEEEADE